jgi:alpha-tubulin suppressor-like RCC1 family protein
MRALCVSCGFINHTVIATEDGSLYGWGSNAMGQLGLGPDINVVNRPTLVPNTKLFQFVSCGNEFTLALDANGSVWSFGCNRYGKLGHGDLLARNIPTLIHNLPTVQMISAGYYHSLILTSNGRVWACGLNSSSQLGLGNDVKSRNYPTEIQGLIEIFQISSGFRHNLALDYVGRVYGFGDNSMRQLPETQTQVLDTPRLLVDNVKSICCGGEASYLQDYNGEVSACGNLPVFNRDLDILRGPLGEPVQVIDQLANKQTIAGGQFVLSIDNVGNLEFYGALSALAIQPTQFLETNIEAKEHICKLKSARSASCNARQE